MDKQDIIDGLDVILGRRGEKISQGDILIVEAAIMAVAKAKPSSEAILLAEQWQGRADDAGRLSRAVLRKSPPAP